MSGPRRARGAQTSEQAEQKRQHGEREALRRARLHMIRERHQAMQGEVTP